MPTLLPTRDLCNLKTLDLTDTTCLKQVEDNLESLAILLGASGGVIRHPLPRQSNSSDSDFTETQEVDSFDAFERQYITRWLTRLVSELILLPAKDDDVMKKAEGMAGRSSELLALCAGKMAAGASIKDHVLGSGEKELRIRLQDAALVQDSLGTHTWGAAPILAQLVLPLLSSASQILELGAGTGLVGLATALWRRRTRAEAEVFVTDYHPYVLQNLAHNVALNGWNDLGSDHESGTKLHVRTLDWQAIHQTRVDTPCTQVTSQTTFACPSIASSTAKWQVELDSQLAGSFDVIIAADCIYDTLHPLWIRSVAEFFLRPYVSGESITPLLHVMVPLRPTHREEMDAVYSAFSISKTERKPQLSILAEADYKGHENFGVYGADDSPSNGLARVYRCFKIGWTTNA